MIKKLKRKIFWSVELSAIAVLLLILVVLNVTNIARYEHEEFKIMSSVLHMDDDRGKGNHGSGMKTQIISEMMRDGLSIIKLDEGGRIITVDGYFEQEDSGELSALTREILAGNRERGKIGAYRYLTEASAAGISIVLLARSFPNSGILQAILLSLAGLIVAGLLFALLARWLSIKLVRPVEKTLEDQKRFIADVSHELKTPVTVINANIAILEKELGPNKWLNYVHSAGIRLSKLLGGMLEYARIEYASSADTQNDLPVHFDAINAITEAALPFESIAYEAGISFDMTFPPYADTIGHAEDLKQIVEILLDNAMKHCNPNGEVCICVVNKGKTRKSNSSPGFIVSVSNTGKEIPQEHLPFLFHRFYRVDPSRTGDGNSFGLGLAIASALATKNGGHISVSSNERLTKFSVEFPGV